MLNRRIRERHLYSIARIKKIQIKVEGGQLKTKVSFLYKCAIRLWKRIRWKQFNWIQGENRKTNERQVDWGLPLGSHLLINALKIFSVTVIQTASVLTHSCYLHYWRQSLQALTPRSCSDAWSGHGSAAQWAGGLDLVLKGFKGSFIRWSTNCIFPL